MQFIAIMVRIKNNLTKIEQIKAFNFTLVNNIRWNFNLPAASRMAVWQHLIRSVKVALSIILKEYSAFVEVIKYVSLDPRRSRGSDSKSFFTQQVGRS